MDKKEIAICQVMLYFVVLGGIFDVGYQFGRVSLPTREHAIYRIIDREHHIVLLQNKFYRINPDYKSGLEEIDNRQVIDALNSYVGPDY